MSSCPGSGPHPCSAPADGDGGDGGGGGGGGSDLPTLPVQNPTRSFWHTTHPNALVHHRTTPDLPGRARVVVIGSGITGAFAARELVAAAAAAAANGNGDRDGIAEEAVVVLEAREICSGATGRVGSCPFFLGGVFFLVGENESTHIHRVIL
jgi:hypothetical protein